MHPGQTATFRCSVHTQQAVAIFCRTCSGPVCSLCLAANLHCGHQYCSLIEAPELIRQKLSDSLRILTNQKTTIENEKRTSDSLFQTTQNGTEELIGKILLSTKEAHDVLSALQKSVKDLETWAILNILAGRVTSLQEPSTDLQTDHLRLLEIRQSQRTLSQLITLQNHTDLLKQAGFASSIIRTVSAAPADATGTPHRRAALPDAQLESRWSSGEKDLSDRIHSLTTKIKDCATEVNGLFGLFPRRRLDGQVDNSNELSQQQALIPQGVSLIIN